MKKTNKKGFTLVELLAVIVILAIILLIAVPNVLGIIEKTRKDSFCASSKLAYNAIELFKLQESAEISSATSDIEITFNRVNNVTTTVVTGTGYTGAQTLETLEGVDMFSTGIFVISKDSGAITVKTDNPITSADGKFAYKTVSRSACGE